MLAVETVLFHSPTVTLCSTVVSVHIDHPRFCSIRCSAEIFISIFVFEMTESREDEKQAAMEAKKLNPEVTLKDLSRKTADFAADREWDQFHSPRNLLLALVGEVGELSEIFQWKGEVPRGLCDWADAEKEHLGEELSDVLLYLVRLADVCDVDLGESALRKLQMNAAKYPVELCKGNAVKHRELANKTRSTARSRNLPEIIAFHERILPTPLVP